MKTVRLMHLSSASLISRTGPLLALASFLSLGAGNAFAQGTWSNAASMPTARDQLGVVQGPDGRIYAIGGQDRVPPPFLGIPNVEIFDPATDSWSFGAPMPTPRYNLGLTSAAGLIYAIGGYNNVNTNAAEAYNPKTDTWAELPPMPTARNNLAAVAAGGRIYAIGGNLSGGGPVTGVVEVFDPVSRTWSAGAPMPTPRQGFVARLAGDGRIYAIGGATNLGPVPIVEAFNPVTNTWSSRAPMLTARTNLTAGVALNGVIYAIGGEANSKVLNVVEAFNPATNSWSKASPMPGPRSVLGAARDIYGRIFAIGGTNLSVPYLNIVQMFTPSSACTATLEEFPLPD